MKEEKVVRFGIKDVLIQLLFIVLFVLLLLWLFPTKKFVSNNDKKVVCEGTSSTCTASTTNNVLVDRIFNENIISMKDAAKSYFTLERLPQNVGDKVRINLGKMLDEKIILPFTDKNGKTCSEKESYVEVVKYNNEYIMKVNLKCGKEENYLLVHMGCYDYCKTTVCEKKQSDVSNPVIHNLPTNVIINNNTSKETIIIDNTTPAANTNFINNVSTNDSANDNKSTNNTAESVNTTNNTTANNNTTENNITNNPAVNNSTVSNSTITTTTNNNNTTINNNTTTNITNNTIVSVIINSREKYICVIVDGVYYDANGNKVTKEEYEKSCNINKEYLYEYIKTTAGSYTESDWSEWSTTKVEASSTVSVQTKTVNTTKLVGYNVKKAYDYNKPIYEEKTVETGLYETKEVCTKYDYVATGSNTYGNWTSQGLVYLDYSPTDTATTKYIYVDDSNWVCGENCTAGTTHAYEKYTRTSTPATEYKCVKSEMKSEPITTTVKSIVGYEKYIVSQTPVYKEESTVYYRYKTRTYTEGTTDIKWSIYNDKTLLNAGYVYTGNKKEK